MAESRWSRIETGAGTKRLHKSECRVSQASPVESRREPGGSKGEGGDKVRGSTEISGSR